MVWLDAMQFPSTSGLPGTGLQLVLSKYRVLPPDGSFGTWMKMLTFGVFKMKGARLSTQPLPSWNSRRVLAEDQLWRSSAGPEAP